MRVGVRVLGNDSDENASLDNVPRKTSIFLDMANVIRMAKQVVRGLPYLEKEVTRRLSVQTGRTVATPSTYYVIFSGKCNLACTFCTIYKEREPILTEEIMHRIVRESKELSKRGFNVSLSGGEPTIFKPIYSTLELAQKLGVNFGFTTNGIALTKPNVERLLSYDPFNINLSLESVDPAVNESVRPMAGGTARTLAGIDNLLAEKARIGSRVSLIVKPTILEQNYRTLPALVRHFGRNSQVQINFQPYVGKRGDPHWVQDLNALRAVMDELRGLHAEGYPIIGGDDIFKNFFDYLSNPPTDGDMRFLDLCGEKRNCDIGYRTMGIYPNGDVFLCELLRKPVGNIHRQSLSEIYYGNDSNRARGIMVSCNIDCQRTCQRPTPLLSKAKAFMRMG